MIELLIAAALASACGAAQAEPPAADRECIPLPEDWRSAATDEDRERLSDWRDAWEESLVQARAAGHGAEIAGEGALLDPDGALADVAPPPGDYQCRTIKIGSRLGLLAYVAYPSFRCRIRIDGDHVDFLKLTGSQRPIGRLYPDTPRRMVFLGTLQLGDERRAYQYGIDRERDLIGALERVGERRWRLVFPYPHFESLVDVIELVPSN